MTDKYTEAKIRALHAVGHPPSEIDKKMGLEPGTAHDAMVEFWWREKNARTRGEQWTN